MIRLCSHRLSPLLAASAAILLAAGSVVPAHAQGTAPSVAAPGAPTVLRGNPPPPECREFAQPVMIGGQMVQGIGEACLGPDNTWHVTRSPPGEPVQGQNYGAAPGAIPYYPGDQPGYSPYGYGGGYYAYGYPAYAGYPSWWWYQSGYGYPGYPYWGWGGFRARFFFGNGFHHFHHFHGHGFPANAARHR